MSQQGLCDVSHVFWGTLILIYIDKLMAVYLKKREKRHRDLVDSYYTMVNEAEKYRDKENSAALVIQKYWRMFRVKWKF
jgi:hypothetical protein